MERDELLLAITRCPEIERARGDAGHPCHRVVCSQDAAGYDVPEPWQGHIETAPILFVSLNPGYGENQVFPTPEWTDADTIDFFRRRFDEEAGWTRHAAGNRIYLRVKDSNGNKRFEGRPVRHWGSTGINGYATKLLGREPVFGRDMTMTMAVHCKSSDGYVAKPAMRQCARKWLNQIMEHSAASIVVLLGDDARNACAELWGFDKRRRVHFDVRTPKQERAVVLLPHPAARNRGKFEDYVTPKELQSLRALLQNA